MHLELGQSLRGRKSEKATAVTAGTLDSSLEGGKVTDLVDR